MVKPTFVLQASPKIKLYRIFEIKIEMKYQHEKLVFEISIQKKQSHPSNHSKFMRFYPYHIVSNLNVEYRHKDEVCERTGTRIDERSFLNKLLNLINKLIKKILSNA